MYEPTLLSALPAPSSSFEHSHPAMAYVLQDKSLEHSSRHHEFGGPCGGVSDSALPLRNLGMMDCEEDRERAPGLALEEYVELTRILEKRLVLVQDVGEQKRYER